MDLKSSYFMFMHDHYLPSSGGKQQLQDEKLLEKKPGTKLVEAQSTAGFSHLHCHFLEREF